MRFHQVIGVYNSIARARLAQEALIVEGVPEGRVAISIDLTEDGVAAEAPGQPYVNQPTDRDSAWFGSRSAIDQREKRQPGLRDAPQRGAGACVVTAEARSSAEVRRVREIMAALRPLDMRVPATA